LKADGEHMVKFNKSHRFIATRNMISPHHFISFLVFCCRGLSALQSSIDYQLQGNTRMVQPGGQQMAVVYCLTTAAFNRPQQKNHNRLTYAYSRNRITHTHCRTL